MKLLKMLVGALITAGILIGATNVALAGSTRQSLSSESALEAIKKRGTLRIGLSTFVPWAMGSWERGTPTRYRNSIAVCIP